MVDLKLFSKEYYSHFCVITKCSEQFFLLLQPFQNSGNDNHYCHSTKFWSLHMYRHLDSYKQSYHNDHIGLLYGFLQQLRLSNLILSTLTKSDTH